MPGNPLQSGGRYTTLAQDDDDGDSQDWRPLISPPPQAQQQAPPRDLGADAGPAAGSSDSMAGAPGSLYEELRAQALAQ